MRAIQERWLEPSVTPEEVPILSGRQWALLNNVRQQNDGIKMCVLEWTLAMEDALDWGRVWAHAGQNQGDFWGEPFSRWERCEVMRW